MHTRANQPRSPVGKKSRRNLVTGSFQVDFSFPLTHSKYASFVCHICIAKWQHVVESEQVIEIISFMARPAKNCPAEEPDKSGHWVCSKFEVPICRPFKAITDRGGWWVQGEPSERQTLDRSYSDCSRRQLPIVGYSVGSYGLRA